MDREQWNSENCGSEDRNMEWEIEQQCSQVNSSTKNTSVLLGQGTNYECEMQTDKLDADELMS